MDLTRNDLQELHKLYRQMRGDKDFEVFAFGGNEGSRFTWVTKLQFSVLTQQYDLVPESIELPKNLKLQRDFVKSRGRAIRDYLLDNEDFIFPEVISISEHVVATPVEGIPNLFRLKIPATSFRYLVDGQGRLIGIKSALIILEKLGNNSIDIKFVRSEGVEKDCQLFADTNMKQIAPNKSQCAAMDSRMAINRFTKRVVESVPELSPLIDYTKTSVTRSSNSEKLWTLNQMVAFVRLVTGTTDKSFEEKLKCEEKQLYWIGFITKYFSILRNHQIINMALTGEMSATQVREASIVGTSVFLKSLALFGKVIVLHFVASGQSEADWSIMDRWSEIDLSNDNEEWLGRCKNHRNVYEDKSFNHQAMVSYFHKKLSLDMPDGLEEFEEEVLISRAKILKTQREKKKSDNKVQNTHSNEKPEIQTNLHLEVA